MAAPAVRKLARDHGIDLTVVRGTGRDGRVTRADVEGLIAPPSVSGERMEISLSKMRQAIARGMSRSMQEAPHFYVTGELDFTTVIAALPDGIGINSLLLYLTVQTLKDVPELNATYENTRLFQYPFVNLAVAVALPDGLITPVLHHADDYSLAGLANRARDLIGRAREGRLRVEELAEGTFTISNLGVVQQVERFTAIINPPQVAILAVGAVKERPVVINGGLHIRTTAFLSISGDHRAVDGLVLARFLEAFDKHLQAFSA
jgi:pyruvate dehydrogenase E2 component (dihydrolipoamide acetyltransferase)